NGEGEWLTSLPRAVYQGVENVVDRRQHPGIGLVGPLVYHEIRNFLVEIDARDFLAAALEIVDEGEVYFELVEVGLGIDADLSDDAFVELVYVGGAARIEQGVLDVGQGQRRVVG